ncbi:hypothetical protein [Chitiniphilus eburneus]|uniref:Uncharacterized protein n=1 Tax=Chitiniphilus eburneus TaxID=2571148 RepID=A0A4U0QCC6_9NEIS|nr:hypothetical protein [Chitiniphilus eburneus]TJZ73484.1 hypothetical protein FAZ21_09825 [Chitiniphilus eburneus]
MKLSSVPYKVGDTYARAQAAFQDLQDSSMIEGLTHPSQLFVSEEETTWHSLKAEEQRQTNKLIQRNRAKRELHEQLKQIAEARGFTVEQLAEALGEQV